MTDRELLELAAKAVGINKKDAKRRIEFNQWNPLRDDGDALRLAVKLKMELDCNLHCATTNGRTWSYADEEQDPYAATRRAIVRASAAIGEKI